jgi:UDP-N-acetylglucosamine transferase subunit ALG13
VLRRLIDTTAEGVKAQLAARRARRVSPAAARDGVSLLVASSGGHLAELDALRPRLNVGAAVEWVTFDTPQARSLLRGEVVHFVRFIAPRDARSILRNLRPALRILRAGRYSRVISTGSGVALVFIPLARAMGITCHYIESAARQDGPSLTARLLSPVPGVRFYSQSRTWTTSRWRYGGSVFDGYEPVAVGGSSIRRVVVTLGTLSFGFRRLVERLITVLPAGADTLWQTGGTDVAGLAIDAHDQLPAHELAAAMRAADVVVSHAGVGSALTILEAGHCPVLVPRTLARGEHVDDHQEAIAADLQRRGLAVCRDADELTFADLARASRLRAHRLEMPPPFALQN